MADGTHDKVKLNVRVPPDKKQEWKDALDEGETLSSLVRRSVDRELHDEYVPRDAVDDILGTTNQTDVDLSSVMTRFDDLQQTVEALEGKFDSLSASDASVEEEGVEDLAMDLLPRLPSYPHDIPEQALRDTAGQMVWTFESISRSSSRHHEKIVISERLTEPLKKSHERLGHFD